jgi:hypothetical protein
LQGVNFAIFFIHTVRLGDNIAKAVMQEKKFCDFRVCGSKEKELSFVIFQYAKTQ